MPIMDGYEATRRIKANPALKAIPIIVVTSYALSGDEDKARAAGCDDYITKPYSPRAVAGEDQRAFALALRRRERRCTILRVFSSSTTTRPIATFWSCGWDRKATSFLQAGDGEEALAVAREKLPDLILLDVMMPKLDGIEVCRRLKADTDLPFMAIILVTAKADTKDVVFGLEAGADEYLTKPVDQAALVARVKSMLRMKELTDQVRAQAADLAGWNRTLEERVTQQLAQIERMDRLKRFLSPQVAELILSSGDDRVLDSHRREVTVVFCDLRGFTSFCRNRRARRNHEHLARVSRRGRRHHS